jgi:hypothetical protein
VSATVPLRSSGKLTLNAIVPIESGTFVALGAGEMSVAFGSTCWFPKELGHAAGVIERGLHAAPMSSALSNAAVRRFMSSIVAELRGVLLAVRSSRFGYCVVNDPSCPLSLR